MSDLTCRFAGDREQAIASYLYDEWEATDRDAFERHLSGCPRCRTEVAALSHVRGDLRAWSPPELAVVGDWQAAGRASSLAGDQGTAGSRRSWWREMPAWAQVAAAVLFLGAAAGAANLNVRYDSNGLRVQTGWLKPVDAKTVAAPANAPWRADLAALEQRLRAESSERQAANVATPVKGVESTAAADVNPEVLRRVRALIDQSEHRQERELALRVAEVMRDVNAERQSDLARIERTMGVIQNTTGIEMMRQRETINNLLVRTSLQK